MNRLSTILLMFAVVGAVLAGVSWFIFVRSVPVAHADARIRARTFSPAHTISRYQASSAATRQSWNRETFQIPDSYVFDLQIDGLPLAARFSLEKSAGEPFRVGQRVHVTYQERGIPPFWKRVYVLKMESAE